MRNSFLILAVIILLVGCSSTKTSSNEIRLGDNMKSIVTAEEFSVYPNAMLAEQTYFDFDGDGVEEKIELYVLPEPIKIEEEGETLWGWDDSHLWQLIVTKGDETFPLYNYSPHFASLKFWIYDNYVPEIIFALEGRDFSIYSYTYNNEKNHFELKDHFSTGHGVRVYSSSFPR